MKRTIPLVGGLLGAAVLATWPPESEASEAGKRK